MSRTQVAIFNWVVIHPSSQIYRPISRMSLGLLSSCLEFRTHTVSGDWYFYLIIDNFIAARYQARRLDCYRNPASLSNRHYLLPKPLRHLSTRKECCSPASLSCCMAVPSSKSTCQQLFASPKQPHMALPPITERKSSMPSTWILLSGRTKQDNAMLVVLNYRRA
jgi:hypothetical protein